jgi:hypothetical protein
MRITLHAIIKHFDFISKYKYIDLKMKKYYVPYTLLPQFNRENTELYFFFPCLYLGETKCENYYISNNRAPTINSIHF